MKRGNEAGDAQLKRARKRTWLVLKDGVCVRGENMCVPGPDLCSVKVHALSVAPVLHLVVRYLDAKDAWALARTHGRVWATFRQLPVACVLRGFDFVLNARTVAAPPHGAPQPALSCPVTTPRLAVLGTVFKHHAELKTVSDVEVPGFQCDNCEPSPVSFFNRILFSSGALRWSNPDAVGSAWLLLPPGSAKASTGTTKADRAAQAFFMEKIPVTPSNLFLPALASCMQVPHSMERNAAGAMQLYVLRGLRPGVLVPVLWTAPGLRLLQTLVETTGVHTKDMERVGQQVWDVWNYARGALVGPRASDVRGPILELVRAGWLTSAWLAFAESTAEHLPFQLQKAKLDADRDAVFALEAKARAREARELRVAALEDSRAALFTSLRQGLEAVGVTSVTEHPRAVPPETFVSGVHALLMRYFDTKVPVKNPHSFAFRVNRRAALFAACKVEAEYALGNVARRLEVNLVELKRRFPERFEEFFCPEHLVCLNHVFIAHATEFLRELAPAPPPPPPPADGGGGSGWQQAQGPSGVPRLSQGVEFDLLECLDDDDFTFSDLETPGSEL